MAKRKVIKRVYEKGQERTVSERESSFRSRNILDKKRIKTLPAKARKPFSEPLSVNKGLETQRKIFVDSYELPASYDATRVGLIVKDPRWVYAYWEIAQKSILDIREHIGMEIEQAKVVLRMYDISLIDFNGANAHSHFDIEITPDTKNWYINLWRDGVSCCAEVGLRTPDSRFYPLARSNYVHTPRAGYSPRTEQVWMDVDNRMYVEGRVVNTTAQRHSYASKQSYTHIRKRKIYLNEEDIRCYYSELTPLLYEIISSRLARMYGRRKLRYAFVLEGSDKERQGIYSMLPKDSFVKKIMIGSSEILVLLGSSEQQIKSGASEFVY